MKISFLPCFYALLLLWLNNFLNKIFGNLQFSSFILSIIECYMFENKQPISHLLQWLNSQKDSFSSFIPNITSLSQANEVGIISDILQKITFLPCQYKLTQNQCYCLLNDSLQLQMKEKMNSDIRKRFFVENPWKTIVQVLIYVCIHSKLKEEFVGRILRLNEETQHKIMDDVKWVKGKTDNIWEKEDVYEEVKKLEEQNEVMKDIIEEFIKETEELKKQCLHFKEDYQSVKLENEYLLREKAQILNKFNIYCSKDVKAVYELVFHDNQVLKKYILELKYLNSKLEEENNQIKTTLKHQSNVIVELKNELLEYYEKVNENDYFAQSNSFEKNCQSIAEGFQNSNSENFKKSSVFNRLTLSTRASSSGFFSETGQTFLSRIESRLLMKDEIEKHNIEKNELTEKIDGYEKQLQRLNQEREWMRLKMENLEGKTSNYSRKMKFIKEDFSELMETFPFG